MNVSPEADLPRAAYASPQAPWNGILVVGEAPGAEEVKQNLPFVGRSGQLLDKALAEAGIIRAACFVANVFRLQPPGNKVDYFFASRRAAAQNAELLLEDYGAMSGKFCRAAFTAELQALRDVIAACRLDELPRVRLAQADCDRVCGCVVHDSLLCWAREVLVPRSGRPLPLLASPLP